METLNLLSFKECNNLKLGNHVRHLTEITDKKVMRLFNEN